MASVDKIHIKRYRLDASAKKCFLTPSADKKISRTIMDKNLLKYIHSARACPKRFIVYTKTIIKEN
jgi:hypothetical protein